MDFPYAFYSERSPTMARQQHSPEEKSKLVLEAIRGERTINEIAAKNNIHPNMLSKWKREAETQLYTLFQDNSSKERKAQKARKAEINDLYAQIGKLTTQNEWLKKIWFLSLVYRNAACLWIWTDQLFQFPYRPAFWNLIEAGSIISRLHIPQRICT